MIYSKEWIRDNTDMYLGTISIKASDYLELLDKTERLEKICDQFQELTGECLDLVKELQIYKL